MERTGERNEVDEISGKPDYEDDEVIVEMKMPVSKEEILQMKLYLQSVGGRRGEFIDKDGNWLATVIMK